MYDPARKKWVQTWVDNGGAYITLIGGPVQGQPYSFELVTVGAARSQAVAVADDLAGREAGQLHLALAGAAGRGSWTDSWVIEYKRRK